MNVLSFHIPELIDHISTQNAFKSYGKNVKIAWTWRRWHFSVSLNGNLSINHKVEIFPTTVICEN